MALKGKQLVASHGAAVVVAAAIAAGITVAVLQGIECPAPDADDGNDGGDPDRPVYHHTPHKGWVNDPNGLVYYKGLWHLFYQYDHSLRPMGHISWGHAVSNDLVHWKEKPVAISYTDDEQIFSGSAVVDENCSSGLCDKPGHPVLIAAYTSCQKSGKLIQSQHIAYSNDLGETWRKYDKNPVIDINEPEFRDPKVFWHAPTSKWIMLVQMAMEHKLTFWQSTDLLQWSHDPSHTFGPQEYTTGVWECPDMFELPVEGTTDKKWVLIVNINPGQRIRGSAAQYYLGTFDGNRFMAEDTVNPGTWLDWGMDNYATVTYNNAPDGRRVSVGWMSNWNYTQFAPLTKAGIWRNGFTIARELRLLKLADGSVRLAQMPVAEVAALRERRIAADDRVTLADGQRHGEGSIRGRAVDIEAVFKAGTATEFGLRVFAGSDQETLVGYDATTKTVFIDRSRSGTVVFDGGELGNSTEARYADVRHEGPFALEDGDTLRLRVLVDTGSVEVFAGQGEMAVTDVIFPDRTKDGIDFYAKGGSAVLESYSVWSMASIRRGQYDGVE